MAKEGFKQIGAELPIPMINDFRKLCGNNYEDLTKRLKKLIKADLIANKDQIKNPESNFLK